MRIRVLIAAALAAGVAAATASAFTEQTLPAEWDVAGVAADGRAIDLFYNAGGCRGTARATAQETPTSVTLTVMQPTVIHDANGAPVPCPAIYRRGLTQVRLAAPLGGRAIKGRTVLRPALETIVFDGSTPLNIRLPRLVGLSPWEAKRALRLRGLAVRIRSTPGGAGLARVVGQAPAPGGAVAKGTAIRLHVARRA